MIHRQNWLDTNAWLAYLRDQRGRDIKTINKYRVYLRHLIEWADETLLPRARNIDPTFPLYLLTARNDGRQERLSYTTIYKALTTTRLFFAYASHNWMRYAKISEGWIETLTPSPSCKPQPTLDDHKYYTLEEIQRIAAVATETAHEARAQAAACMLYLSGMRADTLASIPIHGVDLARRRILQLPTLGARTKNHKAAITYLLDIPDLYRVIAAWDETLRKANCPPESLWFPALNHDGTQIRAATVAIPERATTIRDDLALICNRAGVEYLSPHKLRHGHIVYARSLAVNMEQVKAISQNVMHANTIITDQIYSGLTADKIQSAIASLGKQTAPHAEGQTKSQIMQQIETLLQQLKAT